MENLKKNANSLLQSIDNITNATISSDIENNVLKIRGILIEISEIKPKLYLQLKNYNDILEKQNSEFTFKDKFLGGIFGDKAKLRNRSKTIKEIDKLSKDIELVNSYTDSYFIDKVYEKELQILSRIYALTDDNYSNQCLQVKNIEGVLEGLRDIQIYAKDALIALKNAGTMVVIDSFSKTKLSSLSTSSCADTAEYKITLLEEKCNKFKSKFASDIGSNSDMMLFNNMFLHNSFVSFLSTISLANSIGSARAEVVELLNKVEKEIGQLESKIKDIKRQQKIFIETKSKTKKLASSLISVNN